MVIEDIMIKNWVSYKKIPHRIKKIMGYDVVLDKPGCSTDEDYIIAKIADCQPVELNGEILVECGFLEAKDKYVLDYGSVIILLIRTEDEDYNLSIGLCNMQIRVKYVHELQQILKAHKYDVKFDLNKNNCNYNVGNWVSYNNANYLISDFDDVTEVYTLISQNHNSPKIECKYGEFEPIAITNDNIKINGFIEDADGSLVKIDSDSAYSIYYYSNSMWKITNLVTEKSYDGYIQHFNQLQNICNNLGINVDLKPYSESDAIDKMLDSVFK